MGSFELLCRAQKGRCFGIYMLSLDEILKWSIFNHIFVYF